MTGDASFGTANRIENWCVALTVIGLAPLLRMRQGHVYEIVADGRIECIWFGTQITFDPQITAAWYRAR